MKYRKTNHPILTRILTAILLVTLLACTDSSEDRKAMSEDKTSIKEVKQETQDLIKALGTYTADQRGEAIERTKKALNELDKRIDALETRIDNNWNQMKKAARERARANMRGLRKQRNEVAEWYGRLETSSADAWEHMKKGFSNAYKNLSDAWEKSEKEFGTTN
jgi:septal ring factor EnvC (AmiA/AmiB activator)